MAENDYYHSEHERTENYKAGIQKMMEGKPEDAVAILTVEPVDSICYGLALANAALALRHLDKYDEAIAMANRALEQFKTPGCPHPPTYIQTLRTLAEATAQQGRYLEALPLFNDVMIAGAYLSEDAAPIHGPSIDLECAHAFLSWGSVFHKAGKPDEAIEAFESARKIYRQYPDNNTGRAEVLTNLAHLYREQKDHVKARLALDEALQIAAGNADQILRIRMGQAQAGLLPLDEVKNLFNEAGAAAENELRFDTAHLRYCIAAKMAHDEEDPIWGLEAVENAIRVEPKLEPHNLNPARLHFYKARFYQMQKRPRLDLIQILQEGARVWCERLPGPLALTDYQQAISVMHSHFCWLAQLLLDENRAEEAFLTFEVGRARSFVIQLAGSYDHELVAANPFTSGAVELGLLTRLRSSLGENEVIISVAALHGELVAFIVGKESVEPVRIPFPSREAIVSFNEKLSKMLEQLRQGTGAIALPDEFHRLGTSVAALLKERDIVLLTPHQFLHRVPWRALLRQAGVSWSHLRFATQFSPFLDPDLSSRNPVSPSGAVALGFGNTNRGNSLEDEAKEFAKAFGSEGTFVGDARSTDVKSALSKNAVVLLSCHGLVHPGDDRLLLWFDLKDGPFGIKEMLPEAVASSLVILSACSSGVFEIAEGDYPFGAVPTLLLAGASFCVCARFPIDAHFAKNFFPHFARLLASGIRIVDAFSQTCEEMENQNQDLWHHIACVELIGRGQ